MAVLGAASTAKHPIHARPGPNTRAPSTQRGAWGSRKLKVVGWGTAPRRARERVRGQDARVLAGAVMEHAVAAQSTGPRRRACSTNLTVQGVAPLWRRGGVRRASAMARTITEATDPATSTAAMEPKNLGRPPTTASN